MENLGILPEEWASLPKGIPFFGGMPITNTLVTGLLASSILIILALIVRLLLMKGFTEKPHGLQSVIELIVDSMQRYTNSKVGEKTGDALGPYLFTFAAYVGMNGLIELVGIGVLRPAPSDINQTAAFALVTFFLIRFFAYRKKGVWGRMKSMMKPTPVIAPIKLIVDLAIPVSLACRMFGNLLGGFVIMELLYTSLPFVLPGLASTYFTLFHTGMQTFIFITISLAFIEEALE
jgi:F-type H+-transporting ATPase subunit a